MEKSRTKKRLSLRALAAAAKIPPGTLFNWVRAKSGTPPYTTYKKPLNTRLAATLEIEPEQLWKAFEESLDAYEKALPAPAPPAPPPQRNPPAGISLSEDETPYRTGTLAQLKAMIAATGRQAFTAQEIYAMIDLI